ncbi:uncharacterized protein PRCAT00004216001 [Priceomyces carsonii]|uniref:uncharacterized protein n=1 Tax=Priceomyces carsonii TaxID=28549 RepID=UPI002EDBA0ED|nr:unnamed protein product [Priceomyces carsonii]
MSLFRSLQNSPATISIFHNGKLPASAKIYKLLDNAYFKLNDKKNKFQIDLMQDKMPTYDQYVLLSQKFLKDKASKDTLKQCYPLFSDRKTSGPDDVIIKGVQPSSGLKVFNEGEYSMIYDAFNTLITKDDADIKAEDIFRPPLVVDWDQNLLANDEKGLNHILEKYQD